jgi:hypothetical protein
MVDIYKPRDNVPRSGIYKITHDPNHAKEHEVTCIIGKIFRRAMAGDSIRDSRGSKAAHHIEEHEFFKK